MAKIDYGVDIDLNDNQILNVIIQKVNALPATGSAGKLIYYTVDNTLRYWSGSQWEVISTGGTTPVPSALTPLMDGVASVGSSAAFARGDHRHPSDTTKVDANTAIAGATKCKITYDSKGLVTGGADLAETDIPSLSIGKTSGLQTALDSKQSTSAKDTANGYAGLDASGKVVIGEIPTGHTADTVPILKATITDGKVLKYSAADGGFIEASISAVLTYKGSCTYADLPTTGQQVGDVWNVTDAHGTTPAGTNYAWDGTAWDPLGGDIDLSNYAPKSHASTGSTYGLADASHYGHAMASSTTPIMDGTASAGTEVAKFARGDHVHPTDTSRASASDLTAHTGNGTIHVTASDKNTWSAKAGVYRGTITGNGSTTSFEFTHGLGNIPTVQVFDSSGNFCIPKITVTATKATIVFNTAPANATTYTVVCVG